MKKSVIFCFTGTGNSLRVATDVSSFLPNCTVLPMTKIGKTVNKSEYEYIGFVFPVYFLGLPVQVERFISSLDLEQNQGEEKNETYFFALATCGGFVGNALWQAHSLLQKSGNSLHYGKKITMGANYVIHYDAPKDLKEIEQQYRDQMPSIVSDLSEKRKCKIREENPLHTQHYEKRIQHVHNKDEGYTVSNACDGCKTCGTVCPVHNIDYVQNKPVFMHHCEQCVACINYCPKQAINYKNVTQERGRYHNLSITWETLQEFYTSTDT